MARKETNLFNRIRLATSRLGARMFRNNRGLFLTLDGERKTRAGLEPNGSSDAIGWTPVTITPAMVGQKVAVFTAIEIKTGSVPVTEDQSNYVDQVNKAGGLAGIAYDESDAIDIIKRLQERYT